MPQLMPLNWVFSVMMMFIILVSACVIYSSVERQMGLSICIEKSSGTKNLWYW